MVAACGAFSGDDVPFERLERGFFHVFLRERAGEKRKPPGKVPGDQPDMPLLEIVSFLLVSKGEPRKCNVQSSISKKESNFCAVLESKENNVLNQRFGERRGKRDLAGVSIHTRLA